jgi:hypothetical protein
LGYSLGVKKNSATRQRRSGIAGYKMVVGERHIEALDKGPGIAMLLLPTIHR